MSIQPTLVSFAGGATRGESVVTRVESTPQGTAVVVASTPFHPVDHTWPDQPGDAGEIIGGDQRVPVTEAVMAAVGPEGQFAVGTDIPVRRGTEGWVWLVAHLLDDPAPGWIAEGAQVGLEVDDERRAGLSRGHTACHLASLALDLALADLWRKDAGEDALGNPDFEGRANQSSRIHADGSVDEYRLGKSLRRAGFDTETFAATLAEREERVNAQLAHWVESAAASSIETDGPTITDRRRWRCVLPEGEAIILCGGTHVESLGSFAGIRVQLDLSDPQLLVMTTTATPA
ncbi:hypothetical protein [uncultured Microbacterium sp.]|uniref:hypothetical protein n=1 Tax=uncultured Microbacterium sp. TaxID=191216 RepID=UPI0028DCD3D8|nr:hypothetical protein [uncultured Microbacterium sp.]